MTGRGCCWRPRGRRRGSAQRVGVVVLKVVSVIEEVGVRWLFGEERQALAVGLLSEAEEQVDRLLAVSSGTRFHVLFVLLLATGMRPSEALALKWQDLDWSRGVVRITRTLYTRGKGWRFQDPKSAKGKRSVRIPQEVVGLLLAHRDDQKGSGVPNEHGLMFVGHTGQPVDELNLYRRQFKPLCQQAGLPEGTRLYDLRHTYATLRLAQGDHVKFVSEALGHANIALTLNTYSHVLPGMDDDGPERLGALLFGARSEPARAAN